MTNSEPVTLSCVLPSASSVLTWSGTELLDPSSEAMAGTIPGSRLRTPTRFTITGTRCSSVKAGSLSLALSSAIRGLSSAVSVPAVSQRAIKGSAAAASPGREDLSRALKADCKLAFQGSITSARNLEASVSSAVCLSASPRAGCRASKPISSALRLGSLLFATRPATCWTKSPSGANSWALRAAWTDSTGFIAAHPTAADWMYRSFKSGQAATTASAASTEYFCGRPGLE